MEKDSTVDSSEISYAKFENLDYQDIFDYMLSYERGESYQNLPEIVKKKYMMIFYEMIVLLA